MGGRPLFSFPWAAVGRQQLGVGFPLLVSCGGHVGWQVLVLVLVFGGGDDCVLSKNKTGELRLNLSRS